MKTDAHHHLLMGACRADLEKTFGVSLPSFRGFEPEAPDPIGRLNRWIARYYVPLIHHPDFLDGVLSSAFQTAQADGVQRLETSFCVGFPQKLAYSPQAFLLKIEQIRQKMAPDLEVRVDLGLNRTLEVAALEWNLEAFLETGSPLIGGVDLYDVENAKAPEAFVGIYRKARQAGWCCKAHVGEFGSAESVRHTIETLELDAVQHGIHASESPEVMRWLADRGTVLNLAPESNRILQAVDFSLHPIEKLRDAGVQITFNTDDYLLFEASISQQERMF